MVTSGNFRRFLAGNFGVRQRKVSLVSLAANTGNGVRLVHAGLSFEVPWQDFDRVNSKFGGNMATFKFQSGRTLARENPQA
jgi:hypothetical protein